MNILTKIKSRVEQFPPRIVLLGMEGIGKTTLAAAAPSPLFIAAENGLTGFDSIPHLEPETFSEVLSLCDALLSADSIEYKTIVIDTADWMERLIHAHICKRDGKDNVEAYGFGKGMKIAEQELVLLLSKLDSIRQKHGVYILITSHVTIRTFNDPSGDSWDRYEMKGAKGFAGILREWPDATLFAVYEVFKLKNKDGGKDRTAGGERIMHTTWSPAHDAKNRLNLPEVLPLSWEALHQAIEDGSPSKLREQYVALLKTADMPAADREKWAKVDVTSLPPDRVKGGIAKLQSLQPKTK